MTQLSIRQEILSDVLAFDNEDGKFNYLIGELERISNKIPYSKREEYYKKEDTRVGTMDDIIKYKSLEAMDFKEAYPDKEVEAPKPKDLNNFHYFNEDWNKQ